MIWTIVGQSDSYPTIERKEVTSDYALLAGDLIVEVDATGGACLITLPDATEKAGRVVLVKRVNDGANAVTVDPYGTQEIEGSADSVILAAQFDYLWLWSNGAQWLKFAGVVTV